MVTKVSDMISEEEKKRWARRFWAERQEEADYLGVSLYEYMVKTSNGELQPVMDKLVLHAKAHPKKCPPDCEFVASLNRLKEKYSQQS